MNKASETTRNSPPLTNLFAEMIHIIGGDAFFTDIATLLENHIPFEGLFVLMYTQDTAPASLGSFKNAQNFKTGLENYVRYTYVLNPVYRAFKDSIAPGTYLIADLLPPGYTEQVASSDLHIIVEDKETIGYRTPGWPRNTTEVLALVQLPGNIMVEYSFITSLQGDQTGRCLARLQEIYPVLASTLHKHFEIMPHDFDTSQASPSQDHWFQSFGKEVLTAREQSVVRMILTGHSSNAIALNLGISLPTVKSHRRNIYAKLQISSQAELFSQFVQTLMENTP